MDLLVDLFYALQREKKIEVYYSTGHFWTHYCMLAVNFKQGLYVYGVAGTPVCGLSASHPGNSGEPEYQ